MATKFKVAVISDLHAFADAKGKAPSRLDMALSEKEVNQHPVSGLKKLIVEESLSADLLVCAGDMGDKALPAATIYVWNKIQELKIALKSKFAIATAGNHDMDSRHQHNDFDAKGVLQGLTPPFPGFDEEHLCDRYWARNFTILDNDDWRLLVLNSSAYHGYNKESPEFEHGRVSQSTLNSIEEQLKKLPEKKINILLCHHHPMKDDAINEVDYSEMVGGDRLIKILGSGDYGQWVIIHGHKHNPKVVYSSGGSSASVIFSAGSFSAYLYPTAGPDARNQFYIIEFEIDSVLEPKLDIAAKIKAWDWIDHSGWQKARKQSGIPNNCGFGFKYPSASAQADLIKKLLTDKPQVYYTWEELTSEFPHLEYLIPMDLNNLIKKLEKVGIHVNYDSFGHINQLAQS